MDHQILLRESCQKGTFWATDLEWRKTWPLLAASPQSCSFISLRKKPAFFSWNVYVCFASRALRSHVCLSTWSCCWPRPRGHRRPRILEPLFSLLSETKDFKEKSKDDNVAFSVSLWWKTFRRHPSAALRKLLKQTKQKIKKKTQELIIVILRGYFRVGDLMRTRTPHQEGLDGNAMILAMWLWPGVYHLLGQRVTPQPDLTPSQQPGCLCSTTRAETKMMAMMRGL